MSNPDPCHLEQDAVAESEAVISSLMDQLDAAMLLYYERLQALQACRDRNPGSGGGTMGASRMLRRASVAVKSGWIEGARLVVASWREVF